MEWKIDEEKINQDHPFVEDQPFCEKTVVDSETPLDICQDHFRDCPLTRENILEDIKKYGWVRWVKNGKMFDVCYGKREGYILLVSGEGLLECREHLTIDDVIELSECA